MGRVVELRRVLVDPEPPLLAGDNTEPACPVASAGSEPEVEVAFWVDAVIGHHEVDLPGKGLVEVVGPSADVDFGVGIAHPESVDLVAVPTEHYAGPDLLGVGDVEPRLDAEALPPCGDVHEGEVGDGGVDVHQKRPVHENTTMSESAKIPMILSSVLSLSGSASAGILLRTASKAWAT